MDGQTNGQNYDSQDKCSTARAAKTIQCWAKNIALLMHR